MALMVRFLFFVGMLVSVFVSVSCVSTHTACPHCAGKKHSAVKGHGEHSHSSTSSASICSHCAKKRSANPSAPICSHCAKKHSAAHKQGERSPHSESSSACHCSGKHSAPHEQEGPSSKQTDPAPSTVPTMDKSSVKPVEHAHPSSSAPVQEKKGSALHRVVGDLNISPINGPVFQLSDLKKPKAIVIVMREKDCPISDKYGPRLARLEKKYAKQGVQFIYNYVGQVRSEENAKRDLNIQKFKGPYAIDKTQKVVHALSAKTTGDVFILTPERKVVYRGPVDDQYHLLKSALKPKNHYVADVLEAIVQGKAFSPQELPAPGCLISPPIGQTSS